MKIIFYSPIILFCFFGKNGLYTAVILGIILANLQGGKVSELTIFGNTFVVSMGAIMYSGIYFATDLLNEKYDDIPQKRYLQYLNFQFCY